MNKTNVLCDGCGLEAWGPGHDLHTTLGICMRCGEGLAERTAPEVIWLQFNPAVSYDDQQTTQRDVPGADWIGKGTADVRYVRMSDAELRILRDLIAGACMHIAVTPHIVIDEEAATLKGLHERWQGVMETIIYKYR